jgi:outer membrane lipoprotein carrier protein
LRFAILSSLILFFILILPLDALSIQERVVIQRVREAQERVKDFSADLLQEKRVSLLRDKVVTKGKVRFKKPDRLLIEFFSPEGVTMLLQGKTLLIYFKEEKTAERYSLEGHPLVERYLFFSKDPFDERLAQWKIIEDHGSYWIIEILPKEKEALLMKTKLWISKKEGMIIGMEWVERNGDTTTLRFSNIRVNSGLTDSDFHLSLPQDLKIREVR